MYNKVIFIKKSILQTYFTRIHVLKAKKATTKGQLISKGLFDVLNSYKKHTKKFDFTTKYDILGRIVFVRFLEELKTPKRHFEIN